MKITSLLPTFQSNITKSLVLSLIVTLPLKGQVKEQYLHVLSAWDKEFVEEQMPVILESEKRDIQGPNNIVLEWEEISLSRIDSLTTISALEFDGGLSVNDLNLEVCLIKRPRNSGSNTIEVEGNTDFDVIGVYYRFISAYNSKWKYLPVGTVIPPFPLYFNQHFECDRPELYIADGYQGDYRDRDFENLYVFNLLYTRGSFGFRERSEYGSGLYEGIISENRVDRTYDYSLEFNEEIVKEISSSKFLDLARKISRSYTSSLEQLFDNPISIEWDYESRNSYYSRKKNKNIVNISEYTPYWKFCPSVPISAFPIIGKSDSLVYGHLVVYPETHTNRYSHFFTVVLNPYSHSFADYPLQVSKSFFRYFFFQDVLYPSLNSTDKITKERKHFNNSEHLNEQLHTLWSNFTSEFKQIASRGIEKTQQNVNYGLTEGDDVYKIHYTKDFKQIRYRTNKGYPKDSGILYDVDKKLRCYDGGYMRFRSRDVTCDSLIQRTSKWVSEALNLISELYGPHIPVRNELGTINEALEYYANADQSTKWRYKNYLGYTNEEIIEQFTDPIPELDSLRDKIVKTHTVIEEVAQRLFTLRYYSGKEINEAFNQWKLYYDGLTRGQKRKLRNQFSYNQLVTSGGYKDSRWYFRQYPEVAFGPTNTNNYFESESYECYILFLRNGEVLLKRYGDHPYLKTALSYEDDLYYCTFPRLLDLSTFFPYLN